VHAHANSSLPGMRRGGLVLYSRAGCHLCDEMHAALRARLGEDFPVAIVDVDADPDLQMRYGERVPVLACGDTELCRARYDERKVSAYLSGIR
jgi:glutaredoxin-like protein DUF836